MASLLFAARPAQAVGTAAGTALANQATLTYSYGGSAAVPKVAVAPHVIVARLINVLVTWQDSAPVPSTSPGAARALAFLVTNTGNGAETFKLARNNAVPGDQFDPVSSPAGAIWIESGVEPGFQATGPGADSVYVPGVNDLVLAADGSRQVYLVSNIPAGLATGSFGLASLSALSATPGAAGAAPGTVAGFVAGVPSVVGLAGGQGAATGSYLAAGVSLGLAKSVAAVRDPFGGARVMSGAVLTYRLVVSVTGSGSAGGVVVSDPLPSTVSYVPSSLAVDGAPRTDAADADEASYAAGTVQANLGDIAAPATRVIEFKATVH